MGVSTVPRSPTNKPHPGPTVVQQNPPRSKKKNGDQRSPRLAKKKRKSGNLNEIQIWRPQKGLEKRGLLETTFRHVVYEQKVRKFQKALPGPPLKPGSACVRSPRRSWGWRRDRAIKKTLGVREATSTNGACNTEKKRLDFLKIEKA